MAYDARTVSSPRLSPSFAFIGFVALGVFGGCGPDGEAPDLLERSALAYGQPAFEGRFETRIADMLDGTARVSHHLVAAPEEIEVVLDPSMEIQRDAVVRVWGDEIDDGVIEIDEFEVVSLAPQPLIDPEQRPPRRLATVLVFWNEPIINNNTARDRMFLSDESTNVFYQENSYGKEKMAGNVFGPYEIPNPGSCNASAIASAGLQAFKEKGHNEDDYRQFMWVFPGLGDCGWGGLASVGSPEFPAKDSWYNGNFGCVVRNQEIGHNYGMAHSHSYSCIDANDNAVPYSDNCSSTEYGDPYDPMGGGCAHMNVVQKTFMGWLDECNIVTATADGTFNLLPTELPCNGTQALRFPTFDGRFYWLEYRQPLSFDDGLSGVLVHIGAEIVGNGPDPYIIDMGEAGFLAQGQPYTDPEGAVTFEVVEENPSHAVISVTFPGGGSGEPTCKGGGSPIMEAGAIGSLECSDEPYPLDTNPPEVTITYPENGDYFSPGSSFTLTAEAMDERGITELELYAAIDGGEAEKLFSSFEEPWDWDVENIPEGEYGFQVVAWDGPNWTVSNPVLVHVTDDIPSEDTGTGTGSVDGTTTGIGDGTTGGTEGDTETDGPGETGATDGCGCRHSGGSGPWALGLFALGYTVTRRRRRR